MERTQIIYLCIFIVILCGYTSASISCDLASFYRNKASWTDQTEIYLLPEIGDYIHVTQNHVQSTVNTSSEESDKISNQTSGNDTIITTQQHFHFSWQIDRSTPSASQCDLSIDIGFNDDSGYYLYLKDAKIHTTKGRCKMIVQYPDEYNTFVKKWRLERAENTTLPVYPCLHKHHWRNNEIVYDFTVRDHHGRIDNTVVDEGESIGGVQDESNFQVAASKHLETTNVVDGIFFDSNDVLFISNIYNNTIQCDRIISNSLDNSAIVGMVAPNIKAIDTKTGREFDTVALNLKKIDGRDGSDRCKHANYDMSVEMGAVVPISQMDDSEPRDPTLELRTRLIKRNEWIRLKVIDNKAPVISDVPTQPDRIPRQVQCLSEALKYATWIIPNQYNLEVKVEDNCAPADSLQLNYNWRVIQAESLDRTNGRDADARKEGNPYNVMVSSPNNNPSRSKIRTFSSPVKQDDESVEGLDGYSITCQNRATMILNWSADDGCDDNRASVEHAIRIFDDQPPIQSLGTSTLKFCLTSIPRNKILCLEDNIIRTFTRNKFTDNCDGIVDVNVEGLWDTLKLEKCKSSPVIVNNNNNKNRGGVGLSGSTLSCIEQTPTPIVASIDASCIRIEDYWTKITLDVEASDLCHNKAIVQMEIFIAPTERICQTFGYAYENVT